MIGRQMEGHLLVIGSTIRNMNGRKAGIMKTTMCLTLFALSVAATSGLALAADEPAASGPLVGEVRTLAVAPGNIEEVGRLHHAGWLEASGQLLPTRAFPELFQAIGRTWTRDGVAEDRFAVPELHDRSQRVESSDNPYGVLSPADLVRGGQREKAWLRKAPMSYWIFVGHDVSHLDAVKGTR